MALDPDQLDAAVAGLDSLAPAVVGAHIDGNDANERLVVLVVDQPSAETSSRIAEVMGQIPFEVRQVAEESTFYGGE